MMLNGSQHLSLRQDGFTLIETIITLAVLAIAVVGVLSVFITGTIGSANPQAFTQASHLVQEQIDTIHGDRQDSARGFSWIIPGNYPLESPVASFGDFSRSTSIFCVTGADLNTDSGSPPPCASGYTHITVTVMHPVIGSISADTIVTRY
jgi:prepilin-type N-terminal cleavage/methylation domain-containing protein